MILAALLILIVFYEIYSKFYSSSAKQTILSNEVSQASVQAVNLGSKENPSSPMESTAVQSLIQNPAYQQADQVLTQANIAEATQSVLSNPSKYDTGNGLIGESIYRQLTNTLMRGYG